MAPILALAGFMGSGKTAVGRRVAARLGWGFVDLDEVVEARAGRSIPQIFSTAGEAGFRSLEVAALRDLVANRDAPDGLVIALGGGTATLPEAMEVLGRGGEREARVVYLDLEPERAWDRVRGTDRPLARSFEEFIRLCGSRRAVYEAASDARVDAIADPEEVAGQVVALARQWFGAESVGKAGRGWSVTLTGTARPSHLEGGPGSLARLAAWGSELRTAGRRIYLAADRRVFELWGKQVLAAVGDPDLPLWLLEPGEATKDVTHAAEGWTWLARLGARRDDVVMVLGGGVVGDLAGFVAATYLRGVPVWQVPTTLLAQVDSSVGGKVAVNLPAGKNLVGAFSQPERVLIDPDLLATLPPEEYASGLGEVVKYGLLDGEDLLGTLEAGAGRLTARDPVVLSEVVRRCVAFKAAVVEEDERDQGRRAILNLGHTAGHALEAGLGYGALPHGSAVGLGLLVALAVSEQVLGTDPALGPRVRRLLEGLGLPVSVTLPPPETLLAAAGHDKKATAAGRGFVGLRGSGDPVWGLDVSDAALLDGFEAVRA